jgi:1,4-alpha-glucan branching enzyme
MSNLAPHMTKANPNKKNRQPNRNEPQVSVIEVTLEFHDPKPVSVFVAGTFNHWLSTTTPMTRNAKGRWTLQLSLPPGRYEYRLVVDGTWMADPLALQSVPNPFGGLNSVLHVAAHP